MLAIKGIYDGEKIRPLEKIPYNGKRNVIITFLEEPVDEVDFEKEMEIIRSMRGITKGLNLTEELLKSRKEDLELEKAKWERK
jgi:hypothetical protein